MIRAQVIVRPRTSIFDPQGEAVKQALRSMGLTSVTQANVGKCIELQLDTHDLVKAQEALEGVCRDLLSNPVIEDFELVVMDMAAPPARPKVASKPAARPRIRKTSCAESGGSGQRRRERGPSAQAGKKRQEAGQGSQKG